MGVDRVRMVGGAIFGIRISFAPLVVRSAIDRILAGKIAVKSIDISARGTYNAGSVFR